MDKRTYPKEGKIRIGYCGEMKVPYHISALISNSIFWSTSKSYIHIIFVNFFSTYLLHLF
jgi:hypothetical protein